MQSLCFRQLQPLDHDIGDDRALVFVPHDVLAQMPVPFLIPISHPYAHMDVRHTSCRELEDPMEVEHSMSAQVFYHHVDEPVHHHRCDLFHLPCRQRQCHRVRCPINSLEINPLEVLAVSSCHGGGPASIRLPLLRLLEVSGNGMTWDRCACSVLSDRQSGHAGSPPFDVHGGI